MKTNNIHPVFAGILQAYLNPEIRVNELIAQHTIVCNQIYEHGYRRSLSEKLSEIEIEFIQLTGKTIYEYMF